MEVGTLTEIIMISRTPVGALPRRNKRTSQNLDGLYSSLFESSDHIGDVQAHTKEGLGVCQKLSRKGYHKVGSISNLIETIKEHSEEALDLERG